MAAIEPFNTNRVWVDYEVGGNKHSLMVRTATTNTIENALLRIDGLLTILNDQLYFMTILGARVAAMGSDVTLPEPWPGSSNYGAGAGSGTDAAKQLTFVGRAITGQRWSMQLYGYDLTVPAGWRIEAASVPSLQTARGLLQDSFDQAEICSINRNHVRVYPYVNAGYNDHWIKEARRG